MLTEARLRELLHGWLVSQAAGAPREDARRGELCLAWDEVEAHAAGRATVPPWRVDHLQHCGWCRAAVAAWPRVSGVTVSEVAALRAWLQAQAAGGPNVGRIGPDGRLELRLPSQGPDGPVSIAVEWQGRHVLLVQAESRQGLVVVAAHCAVPGLRDVALPAAALRIQRLADA